MQATPPTRGPTTKRDAIAFHADPRNSAAQRHAPPGNSLIRPATNGGAENGRAR
jgi:hypothetical protein